MKVLFLTILRVDLSQHGIYNDLILKFAKKGHEMYVVSPIERRNKCKSGPVEVSGVHILYVKTLNVQKTNPVEKGIGQLTLSWLFEKAINKYFEDVKFDLILYSTPPITFVDVVKAEKRKNPNAISYLMLKDFFPQNAVDINLLSKNGLRGFIYRLFRKKEKALYGISDFIGCMSPANVDYIIRHNPEIDGRKVEICPNSMDSVNIEAQGNQERNVIRAKYHLPMNKPILFYGGNIGKPQGIPFLIDCLRENKHRDDCHFLIVGDGTEYMSLVKFIESEKPVNVSLFRRLSRVDYDILVRSCDVGLIFLDYRFTIPNYPSRLLTCLMQRKPVIVASDPNSDMGCIAEKNGFGYWCSSNNVDAFTKVVDKMLASNLGEMGKFGYRFYLNNYTTEHTYNAIIQHFK